LYKSFVEPTINNVADIVTLIDMCRKRATPDCSVDMRHHMGPNDLRRAYLTDEETVAMDEGCTDWFQLYNHEPEICEFQKVTRMAEQFNPLEFGTNAVIFPWIDDVDENHLLDPFAYGDCACGSAAIAALNEYRYEAEPIYNPTVQNLFLKFPLLIGGPDDRYTSTVDVDGRIPRCQHITQAREQHKTETDSIYILVDTSFEDINDRLSDIDGYLPSPHTTRSRYSLGSKVYIRDRQTAYEMLPPRCKHGLLHGSKCPICFPNGHNLFNCAECVEQSGHYEQRNLKKEHPNMREIVERQQAQKALEAEALRMQEANLTPEALQAQEAPLIAFPMMQQTARPLPGLIAPPHHTVSQLGAVPAANPFPEVERGMQLPPGLAAPVRRANDYIPGAAPVRRVNDFIPPAFEHPVHARRLPPGLVAPPRLIVEYLAPCFESAQY
jgi:hypothetical protein